ncbi:ankyrin-3-like [Triticum dicoccoides]|uniref:ankyrin-3-like n=1 Tax=Triticum dicoccoides TaxID=85692 RepID=UPI00188ECDAF|nr:ankyrin-3-like [Triticum dicoccoides]
MEKQQQERMLLQAAFDGNLRLVKKMARRLNSGPGDAAIMAAVVDGNSGNSALHLAAMEEKMDVCRYLVEDLRLDINQTNDNGETPLFLSAFFGRTVAAKYLLAHDADPKLGGKTGSPLHAAAHKEHQGIVKLLLSRGIDVDIPSPLGTPLHLAATYGQDGTMKILLEHHADPNKVLNLDDTPLSMAIRPIPTASVNCVKLLIKAGADVNFTDSNGGSYVALAATCGSAGIMNCLLEAGANPNIADEFGITPIEVAASQGKREIVEMLFPVTSPISKLPDWSIDGIISHVKTFGLQQDKLKCQKKRAELKLKAAEAFKRSEYMMAAEMYTVAMELGPSSDDYATLLANRSLCLLRLENGPMALKDATLCRMMRPNWPKACYRQGAAFMRLKDYEKACEAFAEGLKLDPKAVDIENALREATAMKT